MSKNRDEAKPDKRRSIGLFGELAAVEYLVGKGFVILNRNWRCRSGELDIVAKQGEMIIVVEVRTRRAGGRFGTAVESVDHKKQLQVRSTTEVYLSMSRQFGTPVRFDVIAITLAAHTAAELEAYEVSELKHIESAF